jgi:hypothetical protein
MQKKITRKAFFATLTAAFTAVAATTTTTTARKQETLRNDIRGYFRGAQYKFKVCTREAGHDGPCNGSPRLIAIDRMKGSPTAKFFNYCNNSVTVEITSVVGDDEEEVYRYRYNALWSQFLVGESGR